MVLTIRFYPVGKILLGGRGEGVGGVAMGFVTFSKFLL